ncbi:hypothetical protein MNBD_GAMMA10-2242 [hydrothermal vent metagenome]|uniref:Uncharacterized protein n=1 Tax=hydrothermal vent metagenome TaxID=652676 RepID=A0A3B0Y596_9ZZZZ
MIKKILSVFILVFNVSALLWGAYSYYSLSNSPIEAAIQKIKQAPETASDSLKIMKAYSKKEKIKRVDEIIGHYKELAEHTQLTKAATIGSIHTMSQFINYFIIVSLINILSIGYIIYLNRRNYL